MRAERFLLDTHIIVRWLSDPKKLTKEQTRVLENCVLNSEPFAISAITLVEIVLLSEGRQRITAKLRQVFHELDTDPAIRIIPLTTDVALEMAALGDALRDPSDRVIVATARVHHLQLLTADQRIIESDLVPVIE